jgi:UDP-N-acetylmuramate dehydrogenase
VGGLKKILHKLEDIEVFEDKDLTKFSTLQLKARGDLIRVKSVKSLSNLLGKFFDNNIDYTLLGWGANTLLKEKSEKPYIQLAFPIPDDCLKIFRERYVLPANIGLNILTSHASKFCLSGWEVFTGVPASLGGAIFMNAGTNLGEIGNLVESVQIIDKKGTEKKIEVDKNSFSYRKNNFLKPGDVIVSATLIHMGKDTDIPNKIRDYLNFRKQSQPLQKKTCGCTFKNKIVSNSGVEATCHAGQYIDKLGLKGFRYKNLRISPVHANFIENLGESTYTDFVEFVGIINDELELHYGFKFDLEVRL